MRIVYCFGLVCLSVLLILACGCTAPAPSASPETVQTVTVSVQGEDDSEFLALYANSASDIESKLDAVNAKFYPAAMNAGVAYSPSNLRLAALDLKNAADGYHASMLKIGDFSVKENEYLRNEYLGYLTSIKSAGGNIADAAQAEGANDYGLALNYAELAKTTLERIEGVPNADNEARIQIMKTNLDDLITRMKETLTSS